MALTTHSPHKERQFLREEDTPAGSGVHFKIIAHGFPEGPQPTPETPCIVCHWDGNPEWFVQFPWSTVDDDNNSYSAGVWSAKPGCALCALRQRIAEETSSSPRAPDLRVQHGRETDRGFIFIHRDGSPTMMYKIFIDNDTVMSIDHEKAMASPLRRNLITGDTRSAESLTFVQERIEQCSRHHHLCGKPDGNYRPTRLIDVTPVEDNIDDVSLCGPEDMLGPDKRYIALSYCWGQVVPECRLYWSSLNKMRDRIAWEAIPKTMQDAIIYTRRLGVRYLWIDALCILQDDVDDWSHEAATMAEVYRNSYVTLAALHGIDSNCGLFSRLDSARQSQFKLLDVEIADRIYSIYAFNVNEHPKLDGAYDRKGLWPLLDRGWCFQERILAPRVVFFGRDELLWECNETSSCECKEIEHHKPDRAPLKQRMFAQTQDDPKSKRQKDAWRNVVSYYTRTNLSMHRDRLIAINGVAKLFSNHLEKKDDDYLAGFWSASLLQDLTWFSSNGRKHTIENAISQVGALHDEEETFVAPSWSWASVPGPVQWWRDMREADSFPLDSYVSITGYRMEHFMDDSFGLVRSGILELRGHAIQCDLSRVIWTEGVPDMHIMGSSFMVGLALDRRPKVWMGFIKEYTTPNTQNTDRKSEWQMQDVYIIPLGRWGHERPNAWKDGVPVYRIKAMLCRSFENGTEGRIFQRLGFVTINSDDITEQLQFICKEDGRQKLVLC